MTSTLPFAYFMGQVIPSHEAKVSIASNSLQYGTTCFAGIKGYFREGKVRIFRLEDHHARLMSAARILGMDYFIAYQDFKALVAELVDKNQPKADFYIRPFLFSQDQKLAPKPQGLTFDLAIYLVSLDNYFASSRGMRLMVSSWRKFSDAALPTKAKAGGCYVNSFLATAEAMRCGYDEALLMDHEGYVVEASVANILVSHRQRLIMPQKGSALLEGITMRTAIEFLEEEGMPVCFEKIDRSMLYTCDELILTGTAAQITFAESVDGRFVGPPQETYSTEKSAGPVCRLLREKFQAVLAMEHPKSNAWITEF